MNVLHKLQAYVLALLAFALSFGSAHAALPTGVDTALTGIQTDATALAALVAPVMIGILALVIVFKLIKRFGNKI